MRLIIPVMQRARRASVLLALVVVMTLAGCGAHVYHVVREGETLYSISFRHGRDFRAVAQWNDIEPPYTLSVGQHIRIAPPPNDRFRSRQPAQAPAAAAAGTRDATTPARRRAAGRAPAQGGEGSAPPARETVWQWPVRDVRGPPLLKVSSGRRGLDIQGERSEPVRAAAAGRVVYSGAGIPHYGRLLIIKHDARLLSAYAHNERLLVREGQHVVAGQQIAEMGDSGTGTDTVRLHFEIRVDGVPVDPLKYLPGE